MWKTSEVWTSFTSLSTVLISSSSPLPSPVPAVDFSASGFY